MAAQFLVERTTIVHAATGARPRRQDRPLSWSDTFLPPIRIVVGRVVPADGPRDLDTVSSLVHLLVPRDQVVAGGSR